ncbi:MAG: IS701 family transposase, partial [Noviherbaspirillum sp.]
HHHALLTMIAFSYLQHRRLASASQAGKKTDIQCTRSATSAITTGNTPRPYRRAVPHPLRSVS